MAATRSVRTILTRALRVATVVGAGETPDADDMNDALLSLNMMMDAWQAERLYAYAIVERTHPLTAGIGTYTIGDGATISVPRPVRIEYAFNRDLQNYDRQMTILPENVFATIVLKSLGNTFPTVLTYDPTYPFGSIQMYPLPPAGVTLFLGCWEVLSEFANIDVIVSLPPGYEEAILYSMAERLAPEYGKAVSPDIARMAAKARANIQQNNLPEVRVACEFTGVDVPVSFADFVAGNY